MGVGCTRGRLGVEWRWYRRDRVNNIISYMYIRVYAGDIDVINCICVRMRPIENYSDLLPSRSPFRPLKVQSARVSSIYVYIYEFWRRGDRVLGSQKTCKAVCVYVCACTFIIPITTLYSWFTYTDKNPDNELYNIL